MIGGGDQAKANARRKTQTTRRIRKEGAREVGDRRLPKRGGRVVVSGTQGSGKPREANGQVAAITDLSTVVWVLVPTLKKAEEAIGEYRPLARPDSLPAHNMRGRAAPDPEGGGEPMCARNKL